MLVNIHFLSLMYVRLYAGDVLYVNILRNKVKIQSTFASVNYKSINEEK